MAPNSTPEMLASSSSHWRVGGARDEAVLLLLTAFAAAAHCKRRPQRTAWFWIL